MYKCLLSETTDTWCDNSPYSSTVFLAFPYSTSHPYHSLLLYSYPWISQKVNSIQLCSVFSDYSLWIEQTFSKYMKMVIHPKCTYKIYILNTWISCQSLPQNCGWVLKSIQRRYTEEYNGQFISSYFSTKQDQAPLIKLSGPA